MRQRVDDPLRELGARAAEHVVVVGAVGVVARRHQLGVEAVGAARQVLDDVADLLAREQVVDGEVRHRRHAVLGPDPQELLEGAVQVHQPALLGRRHREVREPGLVQAALRAREVADVLVEHEAERRLRVGRQQRVERLRARRVGRLDAREREHVHVRLLDVRARTGAHDREHVGEHQHGDVGEQVVLLHVEHVVVAVRREVDALREVHLAHHAGEHPAERVALRDRGHRGRVSSLTPMRPPITSTNDANTSSSGPGRP